MARLVPRRVGYCVATTALCLVAAAGGAGCGRDTLSSADAVEAFNELAKARDVRLMCPEDIRKKQEIDCTLQGTKTGKTAPVKMRGLDNEDDFIDAVDGEQFRNALERVTQP